MFRDTHLVGAASDDAPDAATLLDADDLAHLMRSRSAERRGDVREALAHHRQVHALRHGRQRRVLRGLAAYGDLPGWASVRWMVHQAVRLDDPGSLAAAWRRASLRLVSEACHVDLVEECLVQGRPLAEAAGTVAAQSWPFAQWLAHERGALRFFVEGCASGALAAHAPLARQWYDVRLGGYRIGGRPSVGVVRVHDPVDRRWLDVLDLGASGEGSGWVLGRLVPSAPGGPPMFDTAPLAVPTPVARLVNASPPRAWLGVLAEAVRGGVVDPDDLLRPDVELLGDGATPPGC